ncbi:MAG: hypothetical protein RLZZ428_1035 [Pseudomonadota bacterium]|jgi:hypothetical protein
MQKTKIAIVGGGVSGVTAALYLSQYGIDVTLFEKKSSLVDGPPWCHLHAGGNLYREISDQQCSNLLEQSIDFIKFYPFAVDYRPTVIALPLTDESTPQSLLPRLRYLRNIYKMLIEEDNSNGVLGDYCDYFRLFSREEMECLKEKEVVSSPISQEEWMIPVAKHLNLDAVQYPLIMVQEFGLNMFRLASAAKLLFAQSDTTHLYLNTTVDRIEKVDNSWKMSFLDERGNMHSESFDYLVNASGFESGKIDDMLGIDAKRMVEFKSSYISVWDEKSNLKFPEIIFHGKRGTPQGMGQFTPYPGGYFQLHGMTKEITLYEDGLVSSSDTSAQPQLGETFLEKFRSGWSEDEIQTRTQKAIEHIARFIPEFKNATVGSKPLFGAQQVSGEDITLRVGEVAFATKGYARCEIIKVSSSIQMAKLIWADLKKHLHLNAEVIPHSLEQKINSLNEKILSQLAQKIANHRGYPESLALRNVPKLPQRDHPLKVDETILNQSYDGCSSSIKRRLNV